MFNKKLDKKPTGISYPFIEDINGTLSMKYDAMKFEKINDQFTVTFFQGKVPIYAYTIDANDEFIFNLSGASGEIVLNSYISK